MSQSHDAAPVRSAWGTPATGDTPASAGALVPSGPAGPGTSLAPAEALDDVDKRSKAFLEALVPASGPASRRVLNAALAELIDSSHGEEE